MCFPTVQQQLKRLRLKRKEMQEQINRGKQLQAEEGLEESLQEDLQKLEATLSKMDQSTESQEKNLEVRMFVKLNKITFHRLHVYIVVRMQFRIDFYFYFIFLLNYLFKYFLTLKQCPSLLSGDFSCLAGVWGPAGSSEGVCE